MPFTFFHDGKVLNCPIWTGWAGWWADSASFPQHQKWALFSLMLHNYHHANKESTVVVVVEEIDVLLPSLALGYICGGTLGMVANTWGYVVSQWVVHLMLAHGYGAETVDRLLPGWTNFCKMSMNVHAWHHRNPRRWHFGTENVVWDMIFGTLPKMN